MNRRVRPMAAISLATTALSLFALSGPAVALPTCGQLATDPAFGLAGNTQISGLTAALQPASTTPPITPYCRVDFTLSGESGPAAGYLPGQSQHLIIRVGLPPNSADITNPIAARAVPWYGQNRDVGACRYPRAGRALSSPTNLGYVGHSHD